MSRSSWLAGSHSLRDASAIIFALSAILPLLLALLLFSQYQLLPRRPVQVGLTVALLLALAGFALLQRLVARITQLAVREWSPARDQAPGPVPAEAVTVPGLGQVTELRQLVDSFARLRADIQQALDRLEDLVRQSRALHEMVELATRLPPLGHLLESALEQSMHAVRAVIGSIMLVDPRRQTLRVAAARGLPSDALATITQVGEGIAGKVVQLGEPVLVEDINTDPRLAKPNDPRYGGGSFISIPLPVGPAIVGVINLAKKRPREGEPGEAGTFTRSDLQFLQALMPYLALILDHARRREAAGASGHPPAPAAP